LVTESKQPWKYIFLLPEYCGMLCIHLHNFVFTFSIWNSFCLF
jgi:hypothetical protein